MQRKKIKTAGLTRFTFSAESITEDEVYKDDKYVINELLDIDIKGLNAIIFYTKNIPIESKSRVQEYKLCKERFAIGLSKLTEYSAGTQYVYVFYKVLTEFTITDLVNKSSQANIVVVADKNFDFEMQQMVSESLKGHIIFFESFGDEILRLYDDLCKIKSFKYLMHYTLNVSIEPVHRAPVHSFDFVENS